jgi:glucosamine--fructose-6-phosphate aminotransferase (isomerizing)
VLTQYKAAPGVGGALVIGISQSGQSPDIVAVLSEAQRQGALNLALTNDPASPLARAAAHTLPLLAGEETAVAATKTYTAQLLALAMMSASLSGSEGSWEELATVPKRMGEALSLWDSSKADLSLLKETARLLVIGRGYNLSTAFELSLKLKETAYVMADPYSSADFLHGPTALLDPSIPLLAIAPAGREFEDFKAVLKLASERGSPLIMLSDAPAPEASLFVPLPKDVPEWLTPLVAIVPGQLLAGGLARARGLTPDAPRGLKKVTLTR